MVRGFVEHGSIFGKGKIFFAKNPEGIRSGLRVDFKKNPRSFLQNILRGTLDRGLISEK